MNMTIRLLIPRLVLALFLYVPAPGVAQSADPVAPGDRVRVRWSMHDGSPYYLPIPRSATMEVVSVDERRLIGTNGRQSYTIYRTAIQDVERRIGTKPASAPAVVIGSASGFAAGFLAGALKGALDPTVNGTGSVSNQGLTVGVLIGAPLGALVAYVRSRSQGIYEDAPFAEVDPSVTVAPSGGVGLSLRIPTR